MPSISKILAATALTGLATAFPQGGFSNTTASATGTNGNATAGAVGTNSTASATGSNSTSINPLTESLYCPTLSGSIILSSTGVEFLLNCGTNHFGIVIDVVSNSTLFARQAVVAPANIEDCLTACDDVSACVGTSFNTAARTCTLYSEVGVAYDDADSDFAIRVSDAAATTASAGQTLTSSVYSTNVVTISSCAPTVTDCPLDAATAGPVVVTQVIPVTSTDYICPSATVIPASPVACSCAFSASTATIYSTTVVQGTTTVTAVSTAVVAVPSPSMTDMSTTTIVGSAALTTAPVTVGSASGASTAGSNAGASATTSGGLASFTGAASNVQAGMGLLAGVAGLAFML